MNFKCLEIQITGNIYHIGFSLAKGLQTFIIFVNKHSDFTICS